MFLATANTTSGMSGWEIAGLAVGALVAVAIVILLVNLVVARLGSRPRTYGQQEQGPGRS